MNGGGRRHNCGLGLCDVGEPGTGAPNLFIQFRPATERAAGGEHTSGHGPNRDESDYNSFLH